MANQSYDWQTKHSYECYNWITWMWLAYDNKPYQARFTSPFWICVNVIKSAFLTWDQESGKAGLLREKVREILNTLFERELIQTGFHKFSHDQPWFLKVFRQSACALERGFGFDRGQTREICEKQEKYFKGKIVIFAVQSLILSQYSFDYLLTYLELYFSDFLAPFVKATLSGCGAFKTD